MTIRITDCYSGVLRQTGGAGKQQGIWLEGREKSEKQLLDGKRNNLQELIAKRSKILEYVDFDTESEYSPERSSNFVDRYGRVACLADKLSIKVLSDDINTINVEI